MTLSININQLLYKKASLYKILRDGKIHRTIQDDTMPNGSIESTIVYVAPFVKCDREEDYEVAWAEFERRGVK